MLKHQLIKKYIIKNYYCPKNSKRENKLKIKRVFIKRPSETSSHLSSFSKINISSIVLHFAFKIIIFSFSVHCFYRLTGCLLKLVLFSVTVYFSWFSIYCLFFYIKLFILTLYNSLLYFSVPV